MPAPLQAICCCNLVEGREEGAGQHGQTLAHLCGSMEINLGQIFYEFGDICSVVFNLGHLLFFNQDLEWGSSKS
jgi:hypothetical protein